MRQDGGAFYYQDIEELTRKAQDWVREQRAWYLSVGAASLVPPALEHAAQWFPLSLLDEVQWFGALERFEDPQFLAQVPQLTGRFTLSKAGGLTLGNLILIRKDIVVEPREFLRVLCHELVHATQYRHLGIDQFIAHYVAQLIDEFAKEEPDERALPLEKIAYEIADEYETGALPLGDVTPRILARLPR